MSPGKFSVAVKARHIDWRTLSRYAQNDIQQGMALEVMVPQGHFGYQPQAERSGLLRRLPLASRYYADDGDYRRHPRHRTRQPVSRLISRQTQQPQRMMFRQALADLKTAIRNACRWCICSAEAMDSDLRGARSMATKLRARWPPVCWISSRFGARLYLRPRRR